jgi:spore maturation protein CgeB
MRILCVLSKFAYGKPERGENYDYVHFLPALERMGHEIGFFDSGDRSLYNDFSELNAALLAHVDRFRPDVIFCVLMHYEIWIETLDLIRNNSPAAIVNWGTDDSWKFTQASRFFAAHVDLHVTTSRMAENRALSAGLANVMLSQWAASTGDLAEPRAANECRYEVSFVGNLYGYRRAWISGLRDSGIDVANFGHGSERGVIDAREIPAIYNSSLISINFSGAGDVSFKGVGSAGRQIKARTFEVPGAGGFLLTEAAPDLEQYFVDGREISIFETPADLIAKVKYFRDNPSERDRIARAGHLRTREQHTYEKRFAEILARLQPVLDERRHRVWTTSAGDLAAPAAQHRTSRATGWLRQFLTVPFSLVFGKERGVRAARRFLYEASWRICGDATYRARGLPGRLFYAES